jgi:hypothetical protein
VNHIKTKKHKRAKLQTHSGEKITCCIINVGKGEAEEPLEAAETTFPYHTTNIITVFE